MVYNNGIVMADLHFNNKTAKRLLEELEGTLFEDIAEIESQNEKISYIVICGDLLDCVIDMNSTAAFSAIKFVNKLADKCKEHNCPLRIIQGTRSHDNNQLRVIEGIVDSSTIDFKVIYTVCDEYLLPEFRVLYIPEEYMEDAKEFYKDYFEEKYDMVFMHGMINDAAVELNCEDNRIIQHKKAPIFNTKELVSIVKGFVLAGHIHRHSIYEEKFYYTGSYSPHGFGETEAKGYLNVLYNTLTEQGTVTFRENTMRLKYDTIEIGTTDSGNPDYMTTAQRHEHFGRIAYDMVNGKLSEGSDFVRLKVNITETYPDGTGLVHIINNLFKAYDNVKIQFNMQHKTIKEKNQKELIDKLKQKYGFIFDKSKTKEEIISEYVKVTKNKDLESARVAEIIYKTIKK